MQPRKTRSHEEERLLEITLIEDLPGPRKHESTKTHEEERRCLLETRRHDTQEEEDPVLRISSPLSDEVEALIHDTIGCCIAVHRALGPGLLESIYSRAVSLELSAAGISFEREKAYPVTYRGQLLCEQHLDFVVGDQIVLEIKSIERLASVHHSQLLNYMRVSKLRVGLLMNFNVVVLQDGMSRKVL